MYNKRIIYSSTLSIILLGTFCSCISDQTIKEQGKSASEEIPAIESETIQEEKQGDLSSETAELENVLAVDKKEIVIPGLKEEYKFIFVNDQHIIVPDGTYMNEKSEEVSQRYAVFCDGNGKTAAETWPLIVDQVNALHPDGVILNGDMVDFFSEANLECLTKELKRIEYPTMYIRADHDLAVWYSDNISQDDVYEKEREAWEMQDVMVQEFEDFMIVGINNNTSQLSDVGLEKIKELWQLNKPIILAMHVPLKSKLNNELSDASKAAWQDRTLLWGEECYYTPDGVTKQFLDMVYAEDSPVVAVVGAHLHFPYEDQLNDTIGQIVFDASYKGTIGIVTVKGIDTGVNLET